MTNIILLWALLGTFAWFMAIRDKLAVETLLTLLGDILDEHAKCCKCVRSDDDSGS